MPSWFAKLLELLLYNRFGTWSNRITWHVLANIIWKATNNDSFYACKHLEVKMLMQYWTQTWSRTDLHCKKRKQETSVFHRRDVAKHNEIRKDNLHGFSEAFACKRQWV
jgi:hypothetical protein